MIDQGKLEVREQILQAMRANPDVAVIVDPIDAPEAISEMELRAEHEQELWDIWNDAESFRPETKAKK